MTSSRISSSMTSLMTSSIDDVIDDVIDDDIDAIIDDVIVWVMYDVIRDDIAAGLMWRRHLRRQWCIASLMTSSMTSLFLLHRVYRPRWRRKEPFQRKVTRKSVPTINLNLLLQLDINLLLTWRSSLHYRETCPCSQALGTWTKHSWHMKLAMLVGIE